jgi:uncharacterized membrane protein
MRMFGFENGIMASGDGWSVVRNGGDVIEWHMGALGVAGVVLGAILWVLVVVTLVLTIITLARRLRHPLGSAPTERSVTGQPGVSSAALRILDDRFALGEITQDEYLERRRTLTGN